ncbi:hypothetical protein ACCS67_00690 [Rhizobium brockwellii]|uniref:hypothetical protein n=1 Tax=Rhizobium brockwellii TaxID=3019932 RepID=UPI003F9A15BF
MPDAIDSLLVFLNPDDLGHSFRNGLLVLFAGLSIIGNNSLCSRLQNAVFNVCGITITLYGIAHELAVTFAFLAA